MDGDVGVALAGHDMRVLVCYMHVYREEEAVGVEVAFLDIGGV